MVSEVNRLARRPAHEENALLGSQDRRDSERTRRDGKDTSTYDAENHIITSKIANATGTATWGPDGRQRMVGSTNPDTAHWDGDAILFATYGSGGNPPVLYIGKLGVLTYDGSVNVYDRDQTGAKVSAHGDMISGPNSGYWIDGWTSGSVRMIQVYGKYPHSIPLQYFTGACNLYVEQGGYWTFQGCPGPTARFEMTRADGYKMVGGIVQGVRTYDPTTGQWLTPDAYAGDVHDPMSQKPFIWNNNNAIEFARPNRI